MAIVTDWLRALTGLACVSAMFASPIPAQAATLGVAPTRLVMDAGHRTGAVTLTNEGDASTMVQVQTFAWNGSLSSEDLEPTRDLLAVPAVFELEPDARQIIRVALRDPGPFTLEKSFRLMITEVPSNETPSDDGVRLTIRLSLPVFVPPDDAEPVAQWALAAREDGPDLVLSNIGTSHFRVQRVDLLEEPEAERATLSIEAPAYVLAGQSHAWDLPQTVVNGLLYLRAETNIGVLEAEVTNQRN